MIRYYKLLSKIRKGKLNTKLKKAIAESEANVEKIEERHKKNL
jgi:hypothetical protein